MKSILDQLRGGDSRSIGKSDEASQEVLRRPALFGDLFAGLLDADRVVRMRAADAVEKVTRTRPKLLQPWKRALLDSLSTSEDKELRWHLAQMLPRLRLTPSERGQAVDILTSYLKDKSSIVRTFSMQALVDLAARDERILGQVTPLIEQLTQTGTPAMRSRGRKLLGELSRREGSGNG